MRIFKRHRQEAEARARSVVGLPSALPTSWHPPIIASEPQPRKGSGRWRPGVLLANLITIGVGGAAGYVSWQHLSHLGEQHGATPEGSFLTPFTIDGMIVVGTLELRQARLERRPAKAWAYGAVLLGVVGTIAGNVAAAPDDMIARLYFAAPAMAFLVSVEVLFGKPLSRNLWEIIRTWWSHRPRGTAKTQGQPVENPKPDKPDERTTPVNDPTPEKPVEAPESPAEPTTLRLVPGVPAKPRPSARRPASKAGRGNPAVVRSGEKVTGTRQNPARMVAGRILEGTALREHARGLVVKRLLSGAPRDGLGAWVAREYDPVMSDRWGLERVNEVGDPAPVAEVSEPPAPVIGPLPTEEDAVPIDGDPDREPARV